LTEEQEGRLLYYLVREARHGIIEPFMLDENVEDIKVVRPAFPVLIVHRNYSAYGWLLTNAIFTDPKHLEELVARLVEKRPTNPSIEN
jgi:type IV secretory pathway ATPase VirB11/archaellum biosynthesis ATPase